MSQSTHAATTAAHPARMEDEASVTEQKQQSVPATTAVSADSGSSPSAAEPTLTAATTDDARAARLARRSQLRDEAERDAAEQERRRMEALATKAAAREARRVSTLAPQLQSSCGPAQRLFADGIASFLGFLSLSDFNSAAQTCKQFRSSAAKVKSLGYVELFNVAGRGDPLHALAGSPFRHLVKSIYDPCDSDTLIWMNEGRYFRPSGWDREHFALLLELSGLTELNIRVDLRYIQEAKTPIQYPAQLQQLVLDIGCDCDEYSWGDEWSPADKFDGAPLLRGLAACASLTILNLRIVSGFSLKIANTLSALKQLKHFSLRSWHAFRFTPALLRAIRGIALESLSLACYEQDSDFTWDADPIGLLLAEPNQLAQLQKLILVPFRWWDASISLSSLPNLTSLEPELVTFSALPHLSEHPKLRTLQLTFDGKLESDMYEPEDEDDDGDRAFDGELYIRAAVALPHLKPLTALTSLHIEHVTFAAADLALLSQTLPLLEVLTLYDDALVSLGGLASLSCLRELTLSLAKHAEIADVAEHVGQCKSLEKLRLDKMSPALSDATQVALKPPSQQLPLLQSFKYSSR